MGALLEQRLSDTDLKRILITYDGFKKNCTELCYSNCIECFVECFEKGRVVFVELEDEKVNLND